MTTDTVGWNSPHLKESQWEGYIDGQRRVEVDGERVCQLIWKSSSWVGLEVEGMSSCGRNCYHYKVFY